MEGVENKQVKGKREAFLERLKGKYPDKDFDDEENLYGQISDDYDEYDKNLSGYQEREKAFSDMFTKDPRSARLFTEWRNGDDPAVALVRMFGTDIKDAIDDPERQEKIAESNKEYVERVAKTKELEEMYQVNLQESLKMLDDLSAEGMSDDDIDNAMAFLIEIIKDGIIGKFSKDSVLMALKAINHDADVSAANQEGLVQGKNTRVEEKLRKPTQGDGVPALNGKNNASTPQRRSMSIFDEARGAN